MLSDWEYMKLNDKYITYEINGEKLLVCTDGSRFSGMVRLNETAEKIVETIKVDRTREEHIEELLKEFSGVSKEELSIDFDDVIEKLSSVKAVDF